MPRNGSGTHTRVHDWTDDADAAIKIRADRMDEDMDDMASEISNSLAKDGQTNPTANLPMATYRHTGVGEPTARTQYATVAGLQDGKWFWVDGGGTADAITATYSPAITALVDGQLCCVRATAANTATNPTFSPNGLTATTIVKLSGAALVAGDIRGDGHDLILRYDLPNTRWVLLNPANASGNITFPATQEPSSGSNTLDDFERGTYSPQLSFGGVATGITTSTNVGYYTKVGNLVTVFIRQVLSSKGAATGIPSINLPFTSGTNISPACMIDCASDFSGLPAAVMGVVSGSTLFFVSQGATGRGSITDANFTNTSDFRLSVTFSTLP